MSINYLNVKNLTLGYGNNIVINNIDLSLKSNKNYRIIGSNGVGKSTLLGFISNNFQGNTFNSIIDSQQIRILEISNEATINLNLSLIENCSYFTQEAMREDEIQTILTEYGMHSFMHDLVKNFSSGMVKRSELAIAKMIDPEILCIDEPLNYLDKEGIKILSKLLKSRFEAGKSNILASQESLNIFEDNYELIDLNVY
ncbi:ATP-binding cassette domain-containing protein [Acidimicrobiia bacterium]|nr:ATP-binding cassette domain-containing protein [Acidimicrobiia bacterium]